MRTLPLLSAAILALFVISAPFAALASDSGAPGSVDYDAALEAGPPPLVQAAVSGLAIGIGLGVFGVTPLGLSIAALGAIGLHDALTDLGIDLGSIIDGALSDSLGGGAPDIGPR